MNETEINRYLEQIINTLNEGLLVVGTDGTILMINEAFERLTGYRAEEVIGRPCTLLRCDACETFRTKENDNWCALFRHGEQDKKRCAIIKKDGGYLHILKNASLLTGPDGKTLGAVETFTDISEVFRLDEKIEQLSRQLECGDQFCGIVGKSPAMKQVFEMIQRAARSDAPVIVYGESGTGKDLVAQAIHRLGTRREGPFIQLNCAALNESLLESELFGHIKGAFTGAYRHRLGRFEAAHGGDLFLDEIGDVPLSVQVKLLNVLESKQIERVGDHRPIPVDVRIITATNKNLAALIEQNLFREDFFFRINVIPIHLPPLRERIEDIPLLVDTFIRRLQEKTQKPVTGIHRAAMEALMEYSWPGNVRELKSTLEYAFVLADKGPLTLEHLPKQPVDKRKGAGAKKENDFKDKEALIEALREAKGNQSQAARILGVCRVTVWNRMKKYGIQANRFRA